MCIICVKPLETNMPDTKTLTIMWQANPDGAGFSYWRPGDTAVTINKGFMKLKALKTSLLEHNFGPSDLVVLHFRWATHGLSDSGNCHPFPLSNKIEALRACNGTFPTALAHNGIFGNMPCHDTLSDTQKFIAKVLCNPLVARNLEDPAIRELIGGYCGTSSKLAIMKPGRVILIGDFEKDAATGLIYSNSGYKDHQKIWGFKQGQGHINDDVEDIDYTPLPKQCELCQSKEEVEYASEYEIFMCDKCYDFNYAQDFEHKKAIVDTEQ